MTDREFFHAQLRGDFCELANADVTLRTQPTIAGGGKL
jgi:hypothetical protein